MRVEESNYNRRIFDKNHRPTIVNSNERLVTINFVETEPDVIRVKSNESPRGIGWRINDELFAKYSGERINNKLDDLDSYYEYITIDIDGKPTNLSLHVQLILDGNIYLLKVISVI